LKVISSSANSHSLQLVIPSLNVDFVFSDPESLLANYDGYTRGSSYVAVGTWGDDADGTRPLQHVATFLFGYETPSSAMPATGTANFGGTATTTVYKDVGSNLLVTSVNGIANLSVDFSSGQVTGALTQMKQYDGQRTSASTPAGFLPWNDVALSARIATGTSRFSGSAAATSAPGTTFSLAGSATGHVDGALYGPNAQYVGAIWSLSDGAVSAMGLLTAKH
jgi:hypothetical protein